MSCSLNAPHPCRIGTDVTPERPGSSHRTLRARAEALLRERSAAASGAEPKRTGPDALHELHELQVHQIELEMQNEELRRAQTDIALTSARYVDLYDHAPVGYCSLAANGVICEANLTLAGLRSGAPSSRSGCWRSPGSSR